MCQPRSTPWRLTWIAILFTTHLFPTTTAYYVMTSRVDRPNWFKSWNYLMDARPLVDYEPGECYVTNRKFGDGEIEAFTVRNNANEAPVFGIALYHSPDCGVGVGKPAYYFIDVPFAVIQFDAFDPYGINLVDLKALGIKWFAGSWKSIYVQQAYEEGGLLAGMDNDGENGVVVWEADAEYPRIPMMRVWIPGVVAKIPEGRPFFETLPPTPDKKRYVYFRDLIERYLTPGSSEIPDVITDYFDKILSNYWGKSRKPLLNGPLRQPGDPKSAFAAGGRYKDKYLPNYDPAGMEFPTIREGIVPGMVYYKGDIMGESEPAPGESRPIYNLQRTEHGNQMGGQEALSMGIVEPLPEPEAEPQGPIRDTGLNDEFQRFISGDGFGESFEEEGFEEEEFGKDVFGEALEPNDSEISQLLDTGSKKSEGLSGEEVRESTALQEEIASGSPARNPANDMEIEADGVWVEIQDDEVEGQRNTDVIQDQQENAEENNQMEEELYSDRFSDESPDENNQRRSPSVSDWQWRPGVNNEALGFGIHSGVDQPIQQEAQQEEGIQIGNMMSPMRNYVGEGARPGRFEALNGDEMDMSARMRIMQDPFEFDTAPFGSTSSHRRSSRIPPFQRGNIDELVEESFSSTSRRPPRQLFGSNAIAEEPGPQNSPDM
ncbi:hypothetical protein TWF718_005342 [Orbilia javanica]|uniref:Uncharacterized protein n=1 Tax=Orbilia javanica TaxID=47235 RepID=A0AAN8RE61_9PEZI